MKTQEIAKVMENLEIQFPEDYASETWEKEVHADLTGYYLASRAAHKWLDVEERYGHLSNETADQEHPPGNVRLALLSKLPEGLR